MKKEQNLENSAEQALTIPVVSSGFYFCVCVRNNIFTPYKRLDIFNTKAEAKNFAKTIENEWDEVAIFPW